MLTLLHACNRVSVSIYILVCLSEDVRARWSVWELSFTPLVGRDSCDLLPASGDQLKPSGSVGGAELLSEPAELENRGFRLAPSSSASSALTAHRQHRETVQVNNWIIQLMFLNLFVLFLGIFFAFFVCCKAYIFINVLGTLRSFRHMLRPKVDLHHKDPLALLQAWQMSSWEFPVLLLSVLGANRIFLLFVKKHFISLSLTEKSAHFPGFHFLFLFNDLPAKPLWVKRKSF